MYQFTNLYIKHAYSVQEKASIKKNYMYEHLFFGG